MRSSDGVAFGQQAVIEAARQTSASRRKRTFKKRLNVCAIPKVTIDLVWLQSRHNTSGVMFLGLESSVARPGLFYWPSKAPRQAKAAQIASRILAIMAPLRRS